MREKTIGASYGDAFLAAMAVGDAKAADIEQWNPVATTFAPDPALHDRYAKLYRIFRDLYPATRNEHGGTRLYLTEPAVRPLTI